MSNNINASSIRVIASRLKADAVLVLAGTTVEQVEAYFRSIGIEGVCDPTGLTYKFDNVVHEAERAKFVPNESIRAVTIKLNKALGKPSNKNVFNDLTWTIPGKGYVIMVLSRLSSYLTIVNNPHAV